MILINLNSIYFISIQWTIIPLFVSTFVEERFRNIKTSNKGDQTQTNSLNTNDSKKSEVVKEKILARIQDLPNWVLFPDFERSEWFNQILDQLWSSLEGFIVTKVFPVWP